MSCKAYDRTFHFSDAKTVMTNNYKDETAHYLISTVAKRSGVKSDLVRAWERRYQAVTPERTAGGHRVYTEQDIMRLRLLNEATSCGHSISRIARFSLEELLSLLEDEQPQPVSLSVEAIAEPAKSPAITPANPPRVLPINGQRQLIADNYIEKCYDSVLAFNAKELEAHFENAIVELGSEAFIEFMLTPLLTQIGDRWKTGELRPIHEHMTSSVIRSLTYILRNNTPSPVNAPRMIVSTPIGQLHELGALLAAIMAELKGWQVTYLGANLPAEEIAAAVRYTQSRAVTISISFSSDDHVVQKELRKLRKLIGVNIALIVGGRAAGHYEAVLDEVGVLKIDSYEHFRQILDDLAKSPSSAAVATI
jgi:DNA-binding transcriptional MerR regulator/methylmalonyl-CoA mutase cobalamin-binding subunit